MATVRMTLDEIAGSMATAETPDITRIEATTEDDIARFNAEDGFDPADTMAGLRRVYSPAEIRERTGFTQMEIATRLRVPVKTWRNWEQGRTTLDPAVRSLLDIVADDPERAFAALGTTLALPDGRGAAEVVQTAIGRRAFTQGRVRIQTSVESREISEGLTLTVETVMVDRRAVAGQIIAGTLEGEIREHMEVVGSDGIVVGTIDGIDGGRLGVRAAGADGQHHYLPRTIVESVADRVTLTVTADEAEARWATA